MNSLKANAFYTANGWIVENTNHLNTVTAVITHRARKREVRKINSELTSHVLLKGNRWGGLITMSGF